MNERRMSLGNRILSLVLALVMVFGMLPTGIFAFTAKAADSTTATNVAAIRQYAANLLNSNFSKAASEDSSTDSDSFTWDTEGQETNWRYFNGVMLQALLMLGVDSNAGNALEFAKDFMDTNTANATKAVTHYKPNEADSVPPALAIFDLLETAEVSEADRDIYEKAVNYVYGQLEAQVKYDGSNGLMDCGGNLLHKQIDGVPTSSWDAYEIGLDGIYMAQPFYMEYAHALQNGLITNTVNNKTANQIYAEVYERLMWVADNMYDETTGLYNHGYGTGHKGKANDGNGDTTTGVNGQFWGRGIGWYAVGLVECIELMPAGSMKNDLIANLKKLFDGMLPYQDTANAVDAIKTDDNYTGMWYNIVNTSAKVKDSNYNRPETSVSGLMSYALLKAYNEGWVTETKYATAGLAAFNGIVTNKLVTEDGKVVIKDIYKQSGVGKTQEYYCTYAYNSNEAKGVGGVLMAAAEAERYIGTAETFTVGVVSAPNITVPLNTAPDYSDVKITLLGSQGTIRNVPVTDSNVTIQVVMAAADELTSAGEGTATVYYGSAPIGTFAVTVVDTTTGETVNGTISVPTDGAVTVPSTPSFSSGNFVKVKSGASGTGFVLTTTLQTGVPYVFTKGINSSTVNGAGYSSGKIAGLSVKGTSSKEVVDGVYTLSAASGSLVYWYVDSENRIYTVDGNTNYYLRLTGTSSGNIELTTTASNASKFTFTVSSGKIQFTDSTHNRNAYINSGGFTNASAGSSNAVYAFEPQSTSDTYAQLTGSEGLVYALGTSADTISSAIKASTAFSVLVANNASGNNATTVAMSNSLVTVEAPSTYDANTAGTYSFIVKYDGVQIGTIPVTTYDNSGSTTTYNVSLTVTPVNMVLETEETAGFTAEVAVADGDTTLSGWRYSDMTVGGYSNVVTVDGNQVTGASAGSTTITVTLNSVSDGTKTYPLSTPITQNISVTVTEPHSHTYTSAVTTAATCTTAGTCTYTCSCGHSYTEDIAALGHTWVEATCTEPKTCGVCGATDGSALGHSYVNGVCTRCDAADPDYEEPTTPPAENGKKYVLDTDGIDTDGIYIIVDDQNNVALKTPASVSDGTAALIQQVTISENIIILSTDVAPYCEWSFASATKGHISNEIASSYIVKSSASVVGTKGNDMTMSNVGSGVYTITGSENKTLSSNGTTWTQDSGNGNVRLYKLDTSTNPDDSCEHSYTGVVTAPTCTAGGYTTYTCSVCGDTYTGNETAALGHSWDNGVETTAPTCTTAGVKTYTCSTCSETKTETIAALGHSWGTGVETTAPTCTTAGVKTYTCSTCSETKTETIPATGEHNYGDDDKCTVCGATKPDDGLTYYLVDEFEAGKEYVIVAVVDGKAYVLKNPDANTGNKVPYVLKVDAATDFSTITFASTDDVGLSLWKFTSKSNGYYVTNNNRHMRNNSTMLYDVAETDKWNALTVNAKSEGNGQYALIWYDTNQSIGITSGAWNRKASEDKDNPIYLYLYQNTNSSSGGTTPDPDEPDTPVVSSEKYIHNFTKDGTSDPDNFYTFELNGSKSGLNVDYGDLTLTTGIKMNSKSSVSFDTTADGTGTLTLVFNPDNSGDKIALDGGDEITIPSTGIVTITGVSAGSHTLARTDGESHLMYIAFTPDKVDGIEITAPGTLYIGGSAESWLPTHELQYVVRHNDEDVTTGYTIKWSVLDDTVVSVDESGKITGLKPGTTSVSAKVTIGSTVYNDTVLVTVAGPAISTTDEMSLMVDVDSMKTGTIGTSVYVANQAANNFTVGYLSSDTNVATVDENGVVTAVGVGTATIYTYAKTINDHTVYSGTPTVDTMPELYATTYVTVTQKEITDASLNTYDFIIMENASNDKTALHELLAYKEDVNGVIDGEEGIKLTITYNTGDTIVAKFEDANKDGIDDNYAANDYGLQIDLDDIDMTQVGIQFAAVTYTDANNIELFRDTIWIHVVEYDPKNYEGTVTQEANIRYQLDTDGIEPNYEYVIVDDRNTTNGTGIAFMNPDTQSLGSSTAAGNTIAIQTADGVETATIANNANATAWLFDSYNPDVDCPDKVVRTQLNASNSQRYVGPGEAQTQMIHGNVAHVYLETVNEAAGEYYIILGFNDNNQPYYLAYENGAWHATTTANTLYLYKKHADITDYGVNYDLYDNKIENVITNVSIPEGNVYEVVEPVITWGGSNTAAQTYTIVWSSSNPSVATVDQNGKVTALTPGTATITATLYDVDGFDVICNVHNMPYMTRTVEFEVIESDAQPKLVPDYLEIGQGSMPNLDKVNIMMIYGEGSEFDFPVDHNLLNFRMADATNSDGEAVGFDNTTLDTYKVPVDYGSSTYYLTIKVVEDPYAGREPADSIPGYPDAGSVRMEKIAQGVLDFATTGVTKIELKAAGVSTKNSVDVILIVDVSNSMSWDINNSSNSTDATRIPTDGVDGVTKLDTAMDVADSFAKILLTVPGGDNTITFVTFAGQNGTTDSYVDSVRTPMVGVSDYSIASGVFAATEFTALTKNGDSVKCTLNIGGYTGNGYGEAAESGTNRGNTNYDFAFGQAIDAVTDLKAKYKAETGKEYDESGRQIQVVFMTDGAPSHYNSKKANGSSDTLWSSSEIYTQLSGVTSKKASEASDSEKTSSMATWLTHMKNYNELATDLYALADGFYVVGFDMDAGGFSFFQWGLADMTRVLEGLVKNTSLPVETADDNASLTTYFNNLAQALAYPGTNAKVTDRIGDNFTLFSGAHMYSEDIITPDADGKAIMSEATLTAMQGMSFPITVASYRLVTAADVEAKESMTIILTDGSTYTGVPTQQHLGLRVAGEDNEDILETITFSADGTQAYSSVLGSDNNIMNDDLDKMIRTIDASTFTYTATISPIKDSDGKVTGYHADQENIIWKINTIEDRELSMSYYAYLEGSLDNPREAKAGVYATNEFAYLEYIDVYGKYVKREYGVPQIAWGAGSVTVRFFLVNKDGEYVNRAGVTFTNPANRIFLNGRAHYEAELNKSVSFTAADALLQAGLAGSNILYDVSAAATVTNSTTANQGGVAWTKNDSLTNINNLLTYTDSSNGYFTSVVIDIPVVMTDLGESTQKMSDTTVVIDYSNPVQWDALSEAERAYDGKEVNNVVYTIELVGFAKYNPNADLKDYVQYANWPTTYATSYGTYGVVYDADNNATDEIKFTPKAMLSGADHVFAVFKFQNSADSTDYHYMYKQVSVVPATVVHYETTGTMGAAFQSNINGAAWSMKSIAESVAGAAQSNVNDQYGKDESYNTCVNFAGGSSLYVENAGTKNDPYPYVKFTFTGTGIDIISKTDPSQGRVKLTLTGKNTGTKKSVMVLNKGVDNLYQIPVISVEGLPFDTYEAEIVVYNKTTAYGGQFYLDAIVVYGSAQETEVIGSNAAGDITVGDMYVAAGESKPQIVEIRDILLGNNTFGDITASGTDINGAVYIDGNSTLGDTSTNFNNYDKIGPNNEAYLSNNQAIAFKLGVNDLNKLPTSLDIGLKSVNGSTAKAVIYVYKTGETDTVPAEYTISTSTAMFYDILGGENIKTFLGQNNEFYVVIANKGEGILSVTDLKVGYGKLQGKVETKVNVDLGELTQATLKASAQVVSVTAANVENGAAIAYAMYTTSIVVVTGQDAQSIEIENSDGKKIAVSASFVDVDNGARRWRVLVRFVELGSDTYTVYGVGTDGQRHGSYGEIDVVVRLFEESTTNN